MGPDIFELAAVDTFFKIHGKEYRLHDPVFEEKVPILKGFEEIEAMPMTTVDEKLAAATKTKELERAYIKVFLPELTEETLKKLGEKATSAVFSQLTKMAGEKFGAFIQKKGEDAKKEEAPASPLAN